MFTFTIKLTDTPNIQDDSYITQLKTKKSVSDFSISNKRKEYQVIEIKLDIELNPVYFKDA